MCHGGPGEAGVKLFLDRGNIEVLAALCRFHSFAGGFLDLGSVVSVDDRGRIGDHLRRCHIGPASDVHGDPAVFLVRDDHGDVVDVDRVTFARQTFFGLERTGRKNVVAVFSVQPGITEHEG